MKIVQFVRVVHFQLLGCCLHVGWCHQAVFLDHEVVFLDHRVLVWGGEMALVKRSLNLVDYLLVEEEL